MVCAPMIDRLLKKALAVHFGQRVLLMFIILDGLDFLLCS